MDIDVVIIGINSEKTLRDCIQSVLNSIYDGAIVIYYVDGGSIDKSVEIAKSFPEVNVLELKTFFPTPGMGRNKGWKEGSSPFVQFLDSDAILDSKWLKNGVEAFTGLEIAAVKGLIKEVSPEASIWNWIGDQEWNDKPGESKEFGGIVMMSRSFLEKSGGFDEKLVAGEDPELSLRVRLLGGKILQIDSSMAKHDLGMTSFWQYWKRAYRTGYGYAAVNDMHKETGFWRREILRIVIRGGGAVVLFLMGPLWWIWSALLLFYPRIFSKRRIEREKGLTPEEASTYAWHCSFVVVPQFFGVARYYIGKWLNWPMINIPANLVR